MEEVATMKTGEPPEAGAEPPAEAVLGRILAPIGNTFIGESPTFSLTVWGPGVDLPRVLAVTTPVRLDVTVAVTEGEEVTATVVVIGGVPVVFLSSVMIAGIAGVVIGLLLLRLAEEVVTTTDLGEEFTGVASGKLEIEVGGVEAGPEGPPPGLRGEVTAAAASCSC